VITHVGLRNHGPHTESRDFRHHARRAFGHKIIDGYASGVVARKCKRDSSTGALTRAGDESDLTAEIQRIISNHGFDLSIHRVLSYLSSQVR
jgi:hypothetical protein